MKAVLTTLLFLVLFLSFAHGQAIAPPAHNENGSLTGNPGVPVSPIQTAPTANMQDMQDAGARFPLLRTLGGMGIVLCLMLGLYYAAKKFAPRYFTKTSSERNLQVIETLSMGDRRSISLIEVAGSRFLVGNTSNQINLLAALPASLSLVSEPDDLSANPKERVRNESNSVFKNLFEVAKKNRTQHMANPLPDDIRLKMRQLRDALDR
jgi:flagellar biosynthetic protein FliO